MAVLPEIDPTRTALFLDFDGTLVEIAPRPDEVVVPADLPGLLLALRDRLGGALAVVSGRPVAAIDRLLAPALLPAAGLHGLEWRTGDGIRREPPPPSLDAVRAEIGAAGWPGRGVLVEDKGLSIALHYREKPALGPEVERWAGERVATRPDLAVLAGKMVVEIKPAAASKASAVRNFGAEAPFRGRRPVFVGDDVTDEDGMRAAIEAGGTAVKVGPGASLAPYRLPAPADLHRWLEELAAWDG